MASESSSGKAQPKTRPGPAEGAKPFASDAIAMLTADHRQVEQLFQQYEKAAADQKAELVEHICKALTIHTLLEEEIFYPACRETAAQQDPLDDAQVEHDSAKLLIADLEGGESDDRYRDAKVRVLSEQIKHHVGEEEQARTGIFAKAQQAGVNTRELGTRIQKRKSELEAAGTLPASRPVSLTGSPQARFAGTKESEMASREQTRDRDDRGRFMGDDDRGGGRGRGRDDDDRGYSSRGASNRERDDEGRFTGGRGGRGSDRDDDNGRSSRGGDGRGWYGDSQGHSEAARRGRDDRDDGRSRSRNYDDDDRSYRSRSSGRDDDDGRGRGQGGWFGDSEGHSEASRRGWEDRGSSRSGGRDYDDDRGGRSSRGRDDDDRSSRGGGDGRGWYGDSQGHSEAARRGWDDRGSSRSSRGGRDDDDDRGGRSSRNRDDDDRGHGGWFGDSRGHAEAARRGWEDRR